MPLIDPTKPLVARNDGRSDCLAYLLDALDAIRAGLDHAIHAGDEQTAARLLDSMGQLAAVIDDLPDTIGKSLC